MVFLLRRFLPQTNYCWHRRWPWDEDTIVDSVHNCSYIQNKMVPSISRSIRKASQPFRKFYDVRKYSANLVVLNIDLLNWLRLVQKEWNDLYSWKILSDVSGLESPSKWRLVMFFCIIFVQKSVRLATFSSKLDWPSSKCNRSSLQAQAK